MERDEVLDETFLNNSTFHMRTCWLQAKAMRCCMRPVERMTSRNEVGITLKRLTDAPTPAETEIGISLLNNQR